MRTRMLRCMYVWCLLCIIFVCITGFLLASANTRNKIHASDSCLLLHCVVAFIKPFISYMADVIVLRLLRICWFCDIRVEVGHTHTHTHHGNFMGVNLLLFFLSKLKSYRTAVCGAVLCITMNVY